MCSCLVNFCISVIHDLGKRDADNNGVGRREIQMSVDFVEKINQNFDAFNAKYEACSRRKPKRFHQKVPIRANTCLPSTDGRSICLRQEWVDSYHKSSNFRSLFHCLMFSPFSIDEIFSSL